MAFARTRMTIAAMLIVTLAGCKHAANITLAYGEAINSFYSTRPACLFAEPLKLPVQVDTKDDAKTAGYDALVDQGLLLRTTAEKKEFVILSKQVTNYDLNDRGRSAWTADTNNPGFGNFCYGHRNVQTIDTSTPVPNLQPGATTQVTYHYTITGMPNWALATETQNAYPDLKAKLAGPSTGSATLVYSNKAWQVQPGSTGTPVRSADGQIVE